MSERVRVSDFDGTVTDVSKEAEPYIATHMQLLSEKLGIPVDQVNTLLKEAENTILNSPGEYGWEIEGRIVAPAVSDPYQLTRAKTLLVLQELQNDPAVKVDLSEEEDVRKMLNELHYLSYQNTGTCFKEGAKEYILELSQSGQFAFVTNSETGSVKRKLHFLLGENDVNVVGNARKFDIDDNWDGVKTARTLNGLDRPIYLRRARYADALSSVGDVQTVIGDIYELDLSLPEARGMTTVLALSSMTPPWEKDRYQDHSNGFATESLFTIIDAVVNKDI